MQAAEQFFEGKFDDVLDDDGDTPMTPSSNLAASSSKPRMMVRYTSPANGLDSDDVPDTQRR